MGQIITYIKRLGMGLSVSPAIWQNSIQRVLQEIPDYRKNYLAIMDDILTHSKRDRSYWVFDRSIQSHNKKWFKDFPKKMQVIQNRTCDS